MRSPEFTHPLLHLTQGFEQFLHLSKRGKWLKLAVSGPSGIAAMQHQLRFLISIMSAKKKKKVPKQNKGENKHKTKSNLSRPSFHLSLFHKREAFNTFVLINRN